MVFIRTWRFITILAMAALTGWAIYRGNAWIPVPAIIAGGTIIWLTRKREKKQMVDERNYNVASKASLFVFRTFTIVIAGIGVTFIALGRGDYPELHSAGLALAYSCCALLLLYYSAYMYYNSKSSGKE
jgi:uncharacterized membrane protein